MAHVFLGSWNRGTIPGFPQLGESGVVFRRGVALTKPKIGMPSMVARRNGQVLMKQKETSKGGGRTPNDSDFLKELQEFIASRGLPFNEVPTMAELIRNGRQDLANKVRRKGYKLVAQLLDEERIAETSGSTDSEDFPVPSSDSVESQVDGKDVGVSLTLSGETFLNDRKASTNVGSSNGGASEGVPMTEDPTSRHSNVNVYSPQKKNLRGDAFENKLELVHGTETDYRLNGMAAGRSPKEEYIQEKQSIRSGDIRDPDLQPPTGHDSELSGNYDAQFMKDDLEGEEYEDESDEEKGEDEDDENNELQLVVGSDVNPQSPEDVASIKAALLKTKLQQYFNSRSEDSMLPISSSTFNNFQGNKATQQDQSDIQPDDQPQVSKTAETQKELDLLKNLLNSRELELSEVSRQLEEAKGMLALARAKATAELVHVKQLAVEQDVRLQLAEKSLSQMKQIDLEWWGEAGRVEVSGSFNGWQNSIFLEPDLSSEIPKPDGSRGAMMWGTRLCLYPGVYEIKFIIDGNWQVDHRREVVMRHTNQNNILKVE